MDIKFDQTVILYIAPDACSCWPLCKLGRMHSGYCPPMHKQMRAAQYPNTAPTSLHQVA